MLTNPRKDGFLEAEYEKRQELLLDNWTFQCKCAHCSAEKEKRDASDKRLSKIKNLKERLSKNRDKPLRFLKHVRSILDLYEEEEIIMPRGMFAQIGALTAIEIGDAKLAAEYANIAKRYMSILAGPDSQEVKDMDDLINNPTKHPEWEAKVEEMEKEEAEEAEKAKKKAASDKTNEKNETK